MIEPHLTPVELQTGALLQQADQEMANVYFPYSGVVSSIIGFASGQIVEAGLTGRNSVVGASGPLDGMIALNDATVQVGGLASMVTTESLRRYCLHSATLRASFARHLEMALAQAQRVAACNAIHTLEQRLCRWLLQAYDLLDGDTLPFTQELMSQMLGVQRSSVAMVAGRLQSDGLINYRRGEIDIVDVKGLQSACCECYWTINAQYHRLIGWVPVSHV